MSAHNACTQYVHVYMYIHVYTCIHVQYIHNTVCTLYIHMYMYLQHHTCTCAYMYTCTCTCICSTCVACVPFTCTFMYMYDDVSTNHMSCMILSCIPVWLAPLPPSLPPSLSDSTTPSWRLDLKSSVLPPPLVVVWKLLRRRYKSVKLSFIHSLCLAMMESLLSTHRYTCT